MYVLKRDTWGGCNYYSAHGAFAGKEQVIKYTTLKYARKFGTELEAARYVEGLPDWMAGILELEEVSGYDQMVFGISPDEIGKAGAMAGPPLGVMICYGEE